MMFFLVMILKLSIIFPYVCVISYLVYIDKYNFGPDFQIVFPNFVTGFWFLLNCYPLI